MLLGYVSDERYVALPDALLELEGAGGSVEARSRATGVVYADVPPGPYKVTLYKPGYGQKSVRATLTPKPKFAHGAVVELSPTLHLVGSYHVSQQNTFTGRLTPAMFDAIPKRNGQSFTTSARLGMDA